MFNNLFFCLFLLNYFGKSSVGSSGLKLISIATVFGRVSSETVNSVPSTMFNSVITNYSNKMHFERSCNSRIAVTLP